MNHKLKFSKETHRARNGVGIDYVGYYPDAYPRYPHLVLFSDGKGYAYDDTGTYSLNSRYDLVPICPFNSKDWVRADGAEIAQIERSNHIPHGGWWIMCNKDDEYRHVDTLGFGYNANGTKSPEPYIIPRAEYEARKAAEPFTTENCRTRDGRKVLWIANLKKFEGIDKPLVAVIERGGRIITYYPDGFHEFDGTHNLDLVKI